MMAVVGVWGVVAFTLYWNLRSARILPSNDHVRVVALLWPLALVGVAGWGLWKLCHLGTKVVVVDTAVSFVRVIDTYKYGRLLPSKASEGNALKPSDEFEQQAAQEVDKLLEEI
jgi:hypothetical protein